MIAFLAVLCSVVAQGGLKSGDPPLAWSPSGDWIAFTVSPATVEQSLSTVPLFPGTQEVVEESAVGGNVLQAPRLSRLWAVRVEDGRAIKVAESTGRMTSPAWAPEGWGLAFGRVVADEADGDLAWEVVVSYGSEQEVVARRPLNHGARRETSIILEPVAWEQGGRLIAVPEPDCLGIELIDLGRRETIRRIDGARLASFSPIGGRLAFFRALADRWELVETRIEGGPELDRPIDLVDHPFQSPSWTADGRALLYLKERTTGEGRQSSLFLYRVGQAEPQMIKEIESPALPDEEILGAYLTIAQDGVDQYFAVQFSQRPSALAYHQGSHPIDRIHPFAGLGMLGAPSLSPSGDRIAVRYGGPGDDSVVGIIEVKTKTLTPLTPDVDSKAAWVAALGQALDLPRSGQERPTRLPFPGELEKSGRFSPTNRRLAQLGGRLTEELERDGHDRSLTAPPSLTFSYFQGEFEAAEQALQELSLETSGPSSDRSLRLLGLRAQLCLARGDEAQAGEIIDFIRNQRRQGIARVESDGSGGFTLSRDMEEEDSWPEALSQLASGTPEAPPSDQSIDTPKPRPVPRSRPVSPDTSSPRSGTEPDGS
jgi:hypothetical protein